EVFDKETSFDPRVDPVVRVEAGRLRSKLREYYELEGQADSVRIDLPKGTYAPVFRFIGPVEAALPRETIIPRIVAEAGSVETSVSVSSSILQQLKEESDLSARAAGGTVRLARHLWKWAVAAIVLVAIAGVAWLLRGPARKPTPVPEAIPLTS